MANFSRKNNKINISSKDLKKAIVDANNKLKKQNDRLSSNIKDKEKELKSLNKEFNSESKRLLELKEAIEFNEERFQKVKFGIITSEKDLSKLLSKEKEIVALAFFLN